jgi:hypothetical protein
MLTRIISWLAIVGLIAVLPLPLSSGFHLALQVLICVAAILMVLEALDLGKTWLAGLFVVVAAVFNPVITPGMPRAIFWLLDAMCLSLFLMTVFAFPRKPRLSIASITDRTPGSQSL